MSVDFEIWGNVISVEETFNCLSFHMVDDYLHEFQQEIENVELSRLMVSAVSPRRPMSSRVLSAKRKAAMRDNKNGYSSRPGSRNNIRVTRVKSSKRKRNTEEIKPCEINIAVSISQIIPQKELTGNWGEEMANLTEQFYKFITENCHFFIERLENALEIREITVSEIRKGSLIINCQCWSLGALESLNQIYRSKRLHAICQNVFVTGSVLGLLAAKDISLMVLINTDSFDSAREMFLSRKFRECNIIHPADLLEPPSDDPVLEFTGKDGFDLQLDRICKRHKDFEAQTKDFLRTINIILPKGKKTISSLKELIQLHTYLCGTETVSSGVRSDLVREFLAIVNNIRLLTCELSAHVQKSQTSVSSIRTSVSSGINGHNPGVSLKKWLLSDIEDMLSPEYVFEEDISTLNRKLSSSEKLFTGLLCYIPLLFVKLQTVLDES
ncbi:hypothetical protein FSP39_010918 [Pinctada imbricata]|uniref:Uncharacterized protein n=1 Tax=Pinctada imbricata TaxID=66713 RepID=A0AA88XRD1_PINIB|nr:hypothetical protein FSP39_010918 [Pinctada imbricata]